MVTEGSTSAPGKFMEVGLPPMVQAAYGLGPETRSGCGRAALAAVADRTVSSATVPVVASLAKVRMRAPLVSVLIITLGTSAY